MSVSLNVAILAAGQGKRMYSTLPKVLHRLAGKPLLGHVVDTARALTPQSICIVYGHGGDAVPNAFAVKDSSQPSAFGGALAWAKQEPQLGTGHAVMQALPKLSEGAVTLVMYGDVPLTRVETLQRLVEIASDGSLAVLSVELSNPTGYGRIVRNGSGQIIGIVEQRDATEEQRQIREVNTGIMAVPTARLAAWLGKLDNNNAQREYYLTDLIKLAVADAVSIKSTQPTSEWESAGVNSKTELAALERIYQREQARTLLDQGVAIIDPARFDVRGTLKCGHDVSIDIDCIFEGDVTLEDGASIGAHCVLKNVRVAAGAQVHPFCHIEDAGIGANSRIGPYARLRPGTKLGEDVHIGNFVEIKNSEFDAHSKANHLAYVGDATIGKKVNIGAGTITCNYDGANKHRTIIEDEAFIGSDTQLVAPVTVGKGATLGAGTTLTRDAPPGQLTVSRTKQTSVAGWQRPIKKVKSEK
jgi:bifunctional UDP-N-acetylglucosamine pyrophosphorylase/glucosamine-1-phosphate N-acetyltransferase